MNFVRRLPTRQLTAALLGAFALLAAITAAASLAAARMRPR